MFSEYAFIAVFYILGILISASLDFSATFFLALSIFITGIIRTVLKGGRNLKIIILAIIFLFGGLRYLHTTENNLYR